MKRTPPGMHRMRIAGASTALAMSLALPAPAAFAQQDWPAKPIRIIVANSPGAALAQQGPRHGLAPGGFTRSVTVSPPSILIRAHPVYFSTGYHRPAPVASSAAPARGPYLIGQGQWVPGSPDAMALQWVPGDTMATPAAPSGHWDWKRASLADLVESARRNKAAD